MKELFQDMPKLKGILVGGTSQSETVEALHLSSLADRMLQFDISESAGTFEMGRAGVIFGFLESET